MDFNDFIKQENQRVNKNKKKDIVRETPIEEREEKLKEIRRKYGYINLRKDRK